MKIKNHKGRRKAAAHRPVPPLHGPNVGYGDVVDVERVDYGKSLTGDTCHCGGTCGQCGSKALTRAQQISRQILDLDAEHDALLLTVKQIKSLNNIRSRLVTATGAYLNSEAFDTTIDAAMQRLHELVAERKRLLDTLCDSETGLEPSDPLCNGSSAGNSASR